MLEQAQKVIETLKEAQLRLVTAESCTGGLLAAVLTDIPGASDIFECGYVTYSNFSKMNLLDVESDTLKTFGAVSEETAIAMAKGALSSSQADIAISITGIAGPGGGNEEKPVGTVYITCLTRNGKKSYHFKLDGTRACVREKAIQEALDIILEQVSD